MNISFDFSRVNANGIAGSYDSSVFHLLRNYNLSFHSLNSVFHREKVFNLNEG